ncbi:MAG: exported or cell surface associated protein of unknown function containing glycoside [Cyanobacteria bacterium RYN_339]|nr:exported or cell surface associated protein of unknown function containing glycoside [Cyanobacteria bacterium RYN_339]
MPTIRYARSARLLPLMAALAALGCAQQPSTVPRAPTPAANAVRTGYQLRSLAPNHAASVFLATSGLELAGYTTNRTATIEVLRPDAGVIPLDLAQLVTVARTVVRFGPDGRAALNRPGGSCWSTATPLLQADDVVRILADDGAIEETRVPNIACIAPLLEGSAVVVTGNATNGFLQIPLPLGELSQELVLPTGTFSNGSPSLLATASGGSGRLDYVMPIPINVGDFSATYAGLPPDDLNRAKAATARVTWRAAAGNEAAVFELPADVNAAPALQPGCPPDLINLITNTDHPVITPENEATAYSFDGVAAPEVVQVDVSVNGGTVGTVLLPPTGRPKGWHLVVPAGQVGPIHGGGPIVADATFTSAAGTPVNLGGNPAPFAQFRFKMPRATSLGGVTATPAGGVFAQPTNVELTPSDPTATVVYTRDGSMPSASSPSYAGVPLAIDRATTLSFRALGADGSLSPVQTETYTFGRVAPLRADPPGGGYVISQFVNLVLNAPATIRFTTDGSDPSPASRIYDDKPILITQPTMLRYQATYLDGTTSPVMHDDYRVVDGSAPVLAARPFVAAPAIAKLGPVPVVMLFTTEQARIRYTTDGTEPNDSSPLCPVGGIRVTPAMVNNKNPLKKNACMIKAFAVDLAGQRSAPLTMYVLP